MWKITGFLHWCSVVLIVLLHTKGTTLSSNDLLLLYSSTVQCRADKDSTEERRAVQSERVLPDGNFVWFVSSTSTPLGTVNPET